MGLGDGGDEALPGDVVDRAGQAAAGEMDEFDGVVGEQGVLPSGDGGVLDVAGGVKVNGKDTGTVVSA
ncbi:hypothetical protein ACGFYU_02925 [Streptomyces sp. NPDC048337]|uniref:hypothetical protein n=1 Tax=Streptomyces sp. NPDC048337 TaxID=3365535 RepID=UPI00371F1E83